MTTLDRIKQNIELPIIVAPMFLVSNSELVIQSCINGVMASYPFTNSRTIEELIIWIEKVQKALDVEKKNNPQKKIAPWIANMIVHSSYKRFDEELVLIKKYQPKIVITALGSPARVVETVHSYGGLVFADVSNLTFAKKAISSGIDGLILLTAGAGGHTGYLNPFAFLNEIRKIWQGIVVLSGGINTAKDIRAAQIIGADFCYMGTRFIATNESAATNEYKEMLVEANIDDIIETKAVTGVSANFMKKSIANAQIDLNNTQTKNNSLNFDERYENNTPKAWKDIWSAGHGVGAIQKIQSTKDILSELKLSYRSL